MQVTNRLDLVYFEQAKGDWRRLGMWGVGGWGTEEADFAKSAVTDWSLRGQERLKQKIQEQLQEVESQTDRVLEKSIDCT